MFLLFFLSVMTVIPQYFSVEPSLKSSDTTQKCINQIQASGFHPRSRKEKSTHTHTHTNCCLKKENGEESKPYENPLQKLSSSLLLCRNQDSKGRIQETKFIPFRQLKWADFIWIPVNHQPAERERSTVMLLTQLPCFQSPFPQLYTTNLKTLKHILQSPE